MSQGNEILAEQGLVLCGREDLDRMKTQLHAYQETCRQLANKVAFLETRLYYAQEAVERETLFRRKLGRQIAEAL